MQGTIVSADQAQKRLAELPVHDAEEFKFGSATWVVLTIYGRTITAAVYNEWIREENRES